MKTNTSKPLDQLCALNNQRAQSIKSVNDARKCINTPVHLEQELKQHLVVVVVRHLLVAAAVVIAVAERIEPSLVDNDTDQRRMDAETVELLFAAVEKSLMKRRNSVLVEKQMGKQKD